MREIRTSGSTRGEWAAPQGVALSPTLPFIRGLFRHFTPFKGWLSAGSPPWYLDSLPT
jgi:hypothetical protein